MDSKMYSLILEDMGRSLKISRRELKSDIKDMANYWEACLQKADIKDRDTAIFILTTCVNCYLRGRGIHLINNNLLRKNKEILVAMVTLVPLYVWTQPTNCFSRIFELVPVTAYNLESPIQPMDILAQAEQILKEKWPE